MRVSRGLSSMTTSVLALFGLIASCSMSIASLEASVDQGRSDATPFFRGDFETGDLSQWSELKDAQLGRSPPGV